MTADSANNPLEKLKIFDPETADLVVAGAGDEYHPVMAYGQQHGKGWSPDGRLRPLDFDRGSFVPGESFAVLLLGRPGQGQRGYGVVRGLRSYSNLVRDYEPPADRPLFLAADGRSEVGGAYRAIAGRGNPVAAYAALLGGSPAAVTLTLLAACATLRAISGVFISVSSARAHSPSASTWPSCSTSTRSMSMARAIGA